jgi:hypothetical protein
LGSKHVLTSESSKNPEGKYQLVDPDSDGEIRPDVRPDISVAKTLTTLDCMFKRERDERYKNAIPRIRAFQVEKC